MFQVPYLGYIYVKEYGVGFFVDYKFKKDWMNRDEIDKKSEIIL